MKTCTKCSETKPLAEYDNHKGAKDGKRPDCKECTKAYRRARRANSSGRVLAEKRRWWRSKKYGIQDSVALELIDRPCDICAAPPGSDDRAHAIDHCHATGAVRGVLCFRCNTALGKFRDSPELLSRAIHYVTRGADYRAVDRD